MSMKAALKAAKNAINEGDFQTSYELSVEILKDTPEEFTALLFAAKSAEMIGKEAESKKYYEIAMKSNPGSPLPLKGLLSLYESSSNYMEYLTALKDLITSCYKSDVKEAAQVWRRYKKFIDSKKASAESRIALYQLELPGSPIFDLIGKDIKSQEHTLINLIDLVEKDEKSELKKVVSSNKFHIHTDKTKTTEAVSYKIYNESILPQLYSRLIDLTHNDDLRRDVEGKLFRYNFELLQLSPSSKKVTLRKQIFEMAQDMILVRSPEPLAWKVAIDWQDPKEFASLDKDTVSYYVHTFPSEGLAKVLQGFMHSNLAPFPLEQLEENKDSSLDESPKDGIQPTTSPEDLPDDDATTAEENNETLDVDWSLPLVLEAISDGIETDKECVLPYWILSSIYNNSREYENAVDTTRLGLDNIKKLSAKYGVGFNNIRINLQLNLATAYVYYCAPTNFDVALQIFDEVLQKDPGNSQASVGKGIILRQKDRLGEAEILLESAIESSQNKFLVLFELYWCKILLGKHEEGEQGLEKCLSYVNGTDYLSLDYQAQIWWRIGYSLWERSQQGTNESLAADSFTAFTKALAPNPCYAPAYSSLGKFYMVSAGDEVRAMKCFYKAFELDAGEVEAAEFLARDLANRSEWQLVDLIASRVIESGKLKSITGAKGEQSKKDFSWPYRALGIAGLNRGDYTQSIKNFQSSLRLFPQDSNAWLGLGECYVATGRYVAASKSFARALQIDPSSWVAKLQLALVERSLGSYDSAIEMVREVDSVLPEGSDKLTVRVILVETLVLAGIHWFYKSHYGDSVKYCEHAIAKGSQLVNQQLEKTHDLWKLIAQASEVILKVESLWKDVDFDLFLPILDKCNEAVIDKFYPGGELSAQSHKDVLIAVITGCYKKELDNSYHDRASKSICYYNYGIALAKIYLMGYEDREKYLIPSQSYLKKAIQLDSKNSEYWNAYGVVSLFFNSRVAQHCFIRSLVFDTRGSTTWMNLGVLCSVNGDYELASDAFDRAISIDPENARSWLGNSILKRMEGKYQEALKSFEHSHSISSGEDGISKLLFGLAIYEYAHEFKGTKRASNAKQEEGIFALSKYLMLSPSLDSAISAQSSLLEREHQYETGISYLLADTKRLESVYEETESSQALTAYAKSTAQLARLYLAKGEYESAIEQAKYAYDLLNFEDDSNDNDDLSKSRLSTCLTLGLSYYFLGDLVQTIELFKQALMLTDEDQDVVILVSQVLWAQGTREERDIAVEQLFESISKKGSSLKTTLLLGALGLVIGDSDITSAAKEEIDAIPVAQTEKEDDEYRIQEVLSLIEKSDSPWRRAAFLWPWDYNVWKNIDSSVALDLAQSNCNNIDSKQLSDAYSKAAADQLQSQRSVFLSPENLEAWKCLGRSTEVV